MIVQRHAGPPGPRFNINMRLNSMDTSHVKDKIPYRPSVIYNGVFHTLKFKPVPDIV